MLNVECRLFERVVIPNPNLVESYVFAADSRLHRARKMFNAKKMPPINTFLHLVHDQRCMLVSKVSIDRHI
jgi:hypothetical protein